MSEELKPCPFGTHKKQRLKMHHRKCRWYESGLYAIQCEVCGIRGPYALGEKRAIERWNTRAERTCRPQGEWERVSQTQEIRHIYCECGEYFGADERDSFPFAIETKAYLPNYCPSCGAKVVGE